MYVFIFNNYLFHSIESTDSPFTASQGNKLFFHPTLLQLFKILLQLFPQETISNREGKYLNREGNFIFCADEFREGVKGSLRTSLHSFTMI
jgi:hypothetical protein